MTETPAATRFIDDQTIGWESVAEGVKRKIMAYDANVMMVKVAFETGGIGTPHQHIHTQMSYVESGIFAITIAGETRTLRTGDVFHVAPNLRHGAECIEAGVLIDVFTPMREDFL